ncbi:MAG: hypothetical protein GY757_46105 [bacterium]|nr:hypothetical protein [bacterium]
MDNKFDFLATNKSFSLSKSNKIYLAIVAGIFFLMLIPLSIKNPDHTGELIGRLLPLLLFPVFVSWIAWRVSGKDEGTGSITFNIVLTLLMLGLISQVWTNIRESQNLNELRVQHDEGRKELLNAEDPEKFDSAYNKYSNSLIDSMDSLAKTSTKSEKQFYKIMSRFLREAQVSNRAWRKSYDAVMEPTSFNLSLLKSDKEFQRQKNILKRFIQKAKSNQAFLANIVPNLKKRLSVLGKGNKFAKEAVEGVKKNYLRQKTVFEPFIQTQLKYGSNMLRVLELLEENKKDWTLENDELLIDNDKLLNRINALIDSIVKNEETINDLSKKMGDVI